MRLCMACGGRNPADSVVCTFCQHPFGEDRRRRVRPGARFLLLGSVLVVLALLLVLIANRAALLALV